MSFGSDEHTRQKITGCVHGGDIDRTKLGVKEVNSANIVALLMILPITLRVPLAVCRRTNAKILFEDS